VALAQEVGEGDLAHDHHDDAQEVDAERPEGHAVHGPLVPVAGLRQLLEVFVNLHLFQSTHVPLDRVETRAPTMRGILAGVRLVQKKCYVNGWSSMRRGLC
jgi:hypothetical protein